MDSGMDADQDDVGGGDFLRFRTDEVLEEPAVTLDAFLGQTNATAVRLEPDEDARALLPHLGRLSLVEVSFPSFRDGRGYSAARVLREGGYTANCARRATCWSIRCRTCAAAGSTVSRHRRRSTRRCWSVAWRATGIPIRPPRMARCRCGSCVMAEAARRLDVIDVAPAYTQADADALNARFVGVDTLSMLRVLFAEGILGRTAVVSSFGTESAALLHLVAQADAQTPVIFVDTLKMFPETLAYRDELVGRFGFSHSWTVEPDAAVLAARDDKGLRWSYDPDGCCDIRKVEPLRRAKQGLDSWISGRKAFQSQTRQNIARFEVENGRLKINPLGDWVKADLDAYFDEHDLPRHPLEAEGYPSIGCQPCTSRVLPGEDPRAGRWRGWDKVECGIHVPLKEDEQPAF